MTTQRTAVLFDTLPIIGHTYTLTHWINHQPHTATLIDLVDKIDDFGTTPAESASPSSTPTLSSKTANTASLINRRKQTNETPKHD